MTDNFADQQDAYTIQRLRNLSLHLQGALANRAEEGDKDAVHWLRDGIYTINAAIDKIGLFNIWDTMWHDAEEEAERLRGILQQISSQYIFNRGDMTDAESLRAIARLANTEESPERRDAQS